MFFFIVHSAKKMLFNSVYTCWCSLLFLRNMAILVSDTTCHIWRIFCPWLVFRNNWLNLNKEALVAEVFWPAGLNKSFIYKRLKLFKYLKVIELISDFTHLWVTNSFSQIRLNLYELHYLNSDRSERTCFWVFVILTLICYLGSDTKLSTHYRN